MDSGSCIAGTSCSCSCMQSGWAAYPASFDLWPWRGPLCAPSSALALANHFQPSALWIHAPLKSSDVLHRQTPAC
uniref:Uncharacterized protein n=1 Tax=Anguilla anguilla TaxID=7936 RepID=A0A0E9WN66_ANGAN